MAGTITREMPSGEIIKHALLAAGTGGTATVIRHGAPVTVSWAVSLTSTATAVISWINPESDTILAKLDYRVRTAGTGTVNIGVGSDGTGSANGVYGGGTLTAGLHHGIAGTGTTTTNPWRLLGPGGTGTNNSFVGLLDDTPTSTMGGFRCYVTYYVVGTV